MVIVYLITSVAVIIFVMVFMQWMGLIPSRFPLKWFDEREITLERRRGLEKKVFWEAVKAITTCCPVKGKMEHYHNFAFNLQDGRKISFVISKDTKSTLEKMYDTFLNNLNQRHWNIEKIDFVFPEYWVKKKKKSISLLKLQSDTVVWTVSNKKFFKKFSELRNCIIDKTEGEMVFTDGVKLSGLENICYWPLLREYLVSKLGSAKK